MKTLKQTFLSLDYFIDNKFVSDIISNFLYNMVK